jgi:hypothetical protein
MDTSRTLGPYAIWKVESNDPVEANQGEFLLRYMLATLSDQTLYLGRCTCAAARTFNTPIISFSSTVDCVYCQQPVDLYPVPRIHEGRWLFGNQPGGVQDEDDIPF